MAKPSLDHLIGVPFVYGGRGPDSFDCYGLVMHLYQREHGVTLPDYTSPRDKPTIAALMANQLSLWRPAERLGEPGSVALFRILGLGSHVGYVLESHRFIHSWEPSGGVCIESLDHWRQRLIGCYVYAGESTE